jgi:hypothetical protein
MQPEDFHSAPSRDWLERDVALKFNPARFVGAA